MYDTIIIGGGIAGMTAALYASRKRMKYELLTAEVGGQFMSSGEVSNYPGIVETTGIDFYSIMQEQMGFNKIDIKNEKVMELKKLGDNFKVMTDKTEYETKTVIVTAGSKPRKLSVPGEEEFARKGVTYCSICDGPLFNGMDVAVVGSGNSALEAVDFLKDIASKIYLLVLGDSLTGHEYLQEKVQNNSKVEILYNAETKEIVGGDYVNALKYNQEGSEKEIAVRGVIVEIGRLPNTEPFTGFLELDDHNHIKIDCQTHTSVPGVFAAGDCASGHEYQYVIAAGQGCMALIKAARYLAERKD